MLNANRFSGSLLLGLSSIFLTILVFSPSALAHCADKHGPGHPHCADDGGGGGGGGSGGDTTVTPQDTYASWEGGLSSSARFCATTYLSLANGTVNYECLHGPDNPSVKLDFPDESILGSGRNTALCNMLSEGLVFGDATNRVSSFIFSSGPEWNGEVCLDDGTGTTCRVWIKNTAYGKLCTQAERDANECGDRLIVMTGFGPAQAATAPELNPFTDYQAISLNELTFDIKGIGKNRTDATCTVDFSEVSVTFYSDPVP